jgi:hypothetical protein
MLAITFGDRIGKVMQPVAGRKQLCHPPCWKRRAVFGACAQLEINQPAI